MQSEKYESILQITLVSMIRKLYPDFVINLSLNGISLKGLSPLQKHQIISQAKKEGLETGIQDLSIYIPKGQVLNFELKVGKNKQSDEQELIESKLKLLGHNYYVIRDVYQAFDIFAAKTELSYREALYTSINIPAKNNKLTDKFLDFQIGADLAEVESVIKSLYKI